MIPALRAVRKHHRPSVLLPLTTSFGRKTISVRYQRVESVSTQPYNRDNMDETHEHQQTITEDIMSHSFGVGYATRSEEEGFGGIIYGGNKTKTKTTKEEEEVEVDHQNHSEYEKTQGSEVSQKEKGRNQTNTS